MIINLAAHTAFDVDSTVSGTVALTRAQLQGLVDEDYTTDVVTLSGTDILVLDVDLGNRIAVLIAPRLPVRLLQAFNGFIRIMIQIHGIL